MTYHLRQCMRNFESENLWMYYFVLYTTDDMLGYSLFGSEHGEYIGEGRSIPDVIYEITI